MTGLPFSPLPAESCCPASRSSDVPAVRHRLLQSRHESLTEVDDEIGFVDLLHVACGELEIVGLGAGRRQVAHVHARAAELLRRIGERIEGRTTRSVAPSPPGRLPQPVMARRAAANTIVRTILEIKMATIARL